jgi:hypothetical protein
MIRPLAPLLALPLLAAAAPYEEYAETYRILQQANQIRDPSLAASTAGLLLVSSSAAFASPATAKLAACCEAIACCVNLACCGAGSWS